MSQFFFFLFVLFYGSRFYQSSLISGQTAEKNVWIDFKEKNFGSAHFYTCSHKSSSLLHLHGLKNVLTCVKNVNKHLIRVYLLLIIPYHSYTANVMQWMLSVFVTEELSALKFYLYFSVCMKFNSQSDHFTKSGEKHLCWYLWSWPRLLNRLVLFQLWFFVVLLLTWVRHI